MQRLNEFIKLIKIYKKIKRAKEMIEHRRKQNTLTKCSGSAY